jgi:hypothetical protein
VTVLTTDITPALIGSRGVAWRTNQEKIAKQEGTERLLPISVAAWVIYAPYAHPFWHSYWLSCVSLRDQEGVPPAILYRPDATHELILFALNPAHPTTIDEQPHFLTPTNFVGQFPAQSDSHASAIIEQTVRDIINGFLSPDTDYRRNWIMRFGDWCLRKEH